KAECAKIAYGPFLKTGGFVPLLSFGDDLGCAAQVLFGVSRLLGWIEEPFAVALHPSFPTFVAARLVFVVPGVHVVFDEEFDSVTFLDGARIIERPTNEGFGVHTPVLLASSSQRKGNWDWD